MNGFVCIIDIRRLPIPASHHWSDFNGFRRKFVWKVYRYLFVGKLLNLK
jgi:hypothetical protein